MRIEMFNGKIPNTTSQSGNQNSQANAAFDLLLAEAGNRQTFEPTVESQPRSREDNRNRERTDESRGRNQSARGRENQQRAEDTANTAATAAVQDTSYANQPENVGDYEVAVDEEQVIAEIAAILQVPAEVVAEMLQKLGLTAEDLTEPKVVLKMLQQALGAESPVELLTDSAFPELYKAINEAMVELLAKAKPDANAKGAEVAVQSDAKATKVLAENLEGLDVALEDGEVVVTKDTSSAEATANDARPQVATTQTATAEVTDYAQQGELEMTDATLLSADEVAVNDSSQTANAMLNVEATAAKVELAAKQSAPQQPVNATDVIEQIMNQVKLSSTGGNFTEMRLTLRPESLGDIVLRVLTQNGIVTAQFEAENQRVKEALESSFNMLREALTEQGIQFSELSVSVRQDENEQLSQFEKARQNSRHRAESIEDVSEDEQDVSYHNGVIDVTA